LKVSEVLDTFGAADAVKNGHCVIKRKPDDPDDENYDCYQEGEDIAGTECRVCYPDENDGGSILKPTPGRFIGEYPNITFDAYWCYIDDPDDDGEVAACRPRHADVPLTKDDGVRFWQCKQCLPDTSDRDTMFKWLPPPEEPDDASLLADRSVCVDPAYFGTTGNPIPEGRLNEEGKADYPYAGGETGRCWQTRCHGMSWQPWLPLGMAGAGGVYQDVQVGEDTMGFIGSFGGGFGGGIPQANPGCYGKQDCGQ